MISSAASAAGASMQARASALSRGLKNFIDASMRIPIEW
jgi:hypothetical protein